MEYVLATNVLSKQYGHFKALDGLSMHVPKGAIYGFVGKNGAGKTTFMRMVSGLATPTAGSMTLFGKTELELERKRIGSLIESPGVYPNMTAKENLEVVRRVFGITKKHAVEEILLLVGLFNTGNKKVKQFSMGMKQRLGLAVSLMRNPDFLILDEPTRGIDVGTKTEIQKLVVKLAKEGMAVVFISSEVEEMLRTCDRMVVMRDGAKVGELSGAEMNQSTIMSTIAGGQ